MTKNERITELETRVTELEQRITLLEARPTFYYPSWPPAVAPSVPWDVLRSPTNVIGPTIVWNEDITIG